MTLSKTKYKFYFIVLVTLVSIRLWSFQVVPDTVYDVLEFLIIGLLVAITCMNWKLIRRKRLLFKYNVLTFAVAVPIISAISAYTFHDQSLIHSALILRTFMFWLFYFVLHIYNVPAEKIIRLMVVVGVIWATLTIIQQFTYPIYYFFTRTDSGENAQKILRAGVYRFMLYRHHYGMFVCYLVFYQYFNTSKLNKLLLGLFMLIGFYYFGTRQFAIALIGCVVIMALLIRGSRKVFPVIFVILAGIIAYLAKDALFGQYIEMTSNQVSKDDDIRILSANFYLFEYWPNNPIARLIGNGLPHSYSTYGKEIETIHETFRFHQVDVGIIGAYSIYGVVYIINVLNLNIKGLRAKYYEKKDLWIRFIFFNSLILLFISEYYYSKSAIPFYCLVFYLTDLSYSRKVTLARARIRRQKEAIETQL